VQRLTVELDLADLWVQQDLVVLEPLRDLVAVPSSENSAGKAGPALLVFESDDEVSMSAHVISTVAKPPRSITDVEAREDGFAGVATSCPACVTATRSSTG
jgi:hypothetical protein